uniref:Alternative protein SHANK2 n=1 Tax=Homo sapiens TaxID=9606 RepID=L8E8F5_HUMAN|nr:alternative protein SHANK2 [Homo sapiens]
MHMGRKTHSQASSTFSPIWRILECQVFGFIIISELAQPISNYKTWFCFFFFLFFLIRSGTALE